MDKGLKILLDYYWESSGWKDKPTISDEDFAVAKREGYMFDLGVQNISHEETLQRLKAVLAKIDPQDVANAFLYSLSTRKLEYRSALGSYWYALAIPRHEKQFNVLEYTCTVCGWHKRIDRNILNFMRYKFGGSGHENADFVLFDLEQFIQMPRVEPTLEDKEILMKMLRCVDLLADNDKAGKLRDAILQERIYKTNKTETRILLGILGICGVLSSAEHPCYVERFADEYERGAVEYKNDFYYPVNRWRKKDGINKDRFLRVFGWDYNG